jgi:hypothetical protein
MALARNSDETLSLCITGGEACALNHRRDASAEVGEKRAAAAVEGAAP